MALMLALTIAGDFSGLKQEVKETSAAFAALSAEADKAGREALDAAKGLNAVEREAQAAAAAVEAVQRKFAGIQPGQRLNLTAEEFRIVAEEAKRSGKSFEDVLGGNRAQLDAMRAAHDPLFAAQRQYLDQLASIRAAHAAGALPQREMQVALAQTKAGFAAQVPIIRSAQAAALDHSKAVQLQNWQLINMGQQLQDVGVQMAMGMNPLMIAAQQGPQMMSAAGGWTNSIALLRSVITPTVIGVGAIATGLVAAGAAWQGYLSSVKEVDSVHAGVGRSIAATRGELTEMAKDAADAGGISVREARGLQAEYLSTGRIGREVMTGLIGVTKDYAATMGMDVGEAGADLKKKFSDPAKGAEELNRALQFLDGGMISYIRQLAEQNREEEAQLVLLSKLPDALVKAREATTLLGAAWNGVANAVSNAWDGLGRFMAGDIAPGATEGRLQELRGQRAAIAGNPGMAEASRAARLAVLDRQIAEAEADIARAEREAEGARLNRSSAQAEEIARRYTPDYARLAGMRTDQSRLGATLNDPAIRGGGADLSNETRAYDGLTRALETYLTPAERVAEQHRIDAAALTAKTPAQKAEIAAARERLAVAGEALPAGEAEARIAGAAAKARLEAAHAISEQNTQLSLNARLTLDTADAWLTGAVAGERAAAAQQGAMDAFSSGADATERARKVLAEQGAQAGLTAAQTVAALDAETASLGRLNNAVLTGSMTSAQAARQASLEAELRPLLAAQANAEGTAKEVLTEIIDALTAARARNNAEASRGAAASMAEGQRDEMELAQRRRELMWAGTAERDTALRVLQTEQQLRRAGIDLLSEEGRAILANARALSEMAAAAEREGASRDMVMRSTENALNRFNDQVASGKLTLEDWGDTAVNVMQDVMREILRLAVTAPIMNSLFGTNYATLGDVGGIVGSFFGGGGATAGSFMDAGTTAAGVAHRGGVVGHVNDNRIVPASVFDGAPRRHGGGLVSGERAIIALDEEEVLTEDDPRHVKNIRRGRASGGGGGYGADAPRVEFHLHEGPGVKTEKRETRQQDGSLRIDAYVEAIEEKMAGNIAEGRSAVGGAMERTYGLRKGM